MSGECVGVTSIPMELAHGTSFHRREHDRVSSVQCLIRGGGTNNGESVLGSDTRSKHLLEGNGDVLLHELCLGRVKRPSEDFVVTFNDPTLLSGGFELQLDIVVLGPLGGFHAAHAFLSVR